MLLHLSTWAEIEAYLARSKTVVIPIGSNEQHGPTGLLGTDWLCPEIIAREAERASPELLVAAAVLTCPVVQNAGSGIALHGSVVDGAAGAGYVCADAAAGSNANVNSPRAAKTGIAKRPSRVRIVMSSSCPTPGSH